MEVSRLLIELIVQDDKGIGRKTGVISESHGRMDARTRVGVYILGRPAVARAAPPGPS